MMLSAASRFDGGDGYVRNTRSQFDRPQSTTTTYFAFQILKERRAGGQRGARGGVLADGRESSRSKPLSRDESVTRGVNLPLKSPVGLRVRPPRPG